MSDIVSGMANLEDHYRIISVGEDHHVIMAKNEEKPTLTIENLDKQWVEVILKEINRAYNKGFTEGSRREHTVENPEPNLHDME